jgi:hypothetical protein
MFMTSLQNIFRLLKFNVLFLTPVISKAKYKFRAGAMLLIYVVYKHL